MIHINSRRLMFGIIAVFSSIFLAYYFLVPDSLSDKVNWMPNEDYDFECSKNIFRYFGKRNCFEEPHIFFVETSDSATLNVRQACAVESTARHNPSMEIYVLMTTPDPIELDHDLMKKLTSIRNVHPVQISVDALVHGSPLSKWYRNGKWGKSKWMISHMSDALRFLLMWRYGGTYLDLDVVTLHPYGHLENTAIAENWESVAASMLFFDKKHELMRRCVFAFAENYDPHNFAKNGPGLITDNINKYCNTNVIRQVSRSNCGINILPPQAAFPITYDKWRDYFVPNAVQLVTATFNSSYMIHVWNKLSKEYNVKVGSNSLYELAVKQHCPLVYRYAQKEGFI